MHTFIDNHYVVTVLQPDADRYDSDPATDIVNTENYDEVTFIVAEGAGGTGTATVTIEECDDVTPSNSTAIAFKYKEVTTLGTEPAAFTAATSSGVATTAGANKMFIARVKAEDLADGFPYVRMVLTEVADSPVDAGVIAVLSNPRYGGGVKVSPLV